MRYILRRLGFYLIAAWVSLTLNFLIPRLAPGDPAAALEARFRGRLGPEAMKALREAFGYTETPRDATFLERTGLGLEQYFLYLKHLFQGDLGTSVAYFPAPVTDVIGTGLMWTLVLAGAAVVIAFLLGTLLGIVSAWWRGSWFDSVTPPMLIFLGAFPYFWLALLLLYYFGFLLDWFPIRHAYADHLEPGLSWDFLSSALEHMVLPAAAIVIASLGGWMLGMRNTMIGVLSEDYITMAQAKGLSPWRVMFHYAARNAMLPNVTGFGMALGFVLSGSLLTEIVFSYPGQGFLLFEAVTTKDYPLMQGLFLTITFAVLAANWLVDIVYVWLDPRTRR